MPDKVAPLADLKKAKEEEYFRKQEQSLIEKMRQRASNENQKQELSEFLCIADEDILNSLQELGYSRDTVFLLFLVPLVHVGWIDGYVTEKERELILEIARVRGLDEDTTAEAQLLAWLENRPSEEFFQKTLTLIRNIFEVWPHAASDIRKRNLAYFCDLIANASGGFLGFGKVSAAQRELLDKISDELERNHPVATEQVIREVERVPLDH